MGVEARAEVAREAAAWGQEGMGAEGTAVVEAPREAEEAGVQWVVVEEGVACPQARVAAALVAGGQAALMVAHEEAQTGEEALVEVAWVEACWVGVGWEADQEVEVGQVAHLQAAQAAVWVGAAMGEGVREVVEPVVEARGVVVLEEGETEEAAAAREAAEEGHAGMAPAAGCAVASVAAVAYPQASVAAWPVAETMVEVAVVAGARAAAAQAAASEEAAPPEEAAWAMEGTAAELAAEEASQACQMAPAAAPEAAATREEEGSVMVAAVTAAVALEAAVRVVGAAVVEARAG